MLWGWNATTNSPPSRPIDTCRRGGKRVLPDVVALSTYATPTLLNNREERSSGGRNNMCNSGRGPAAMLAIFIRRVGPRRAGLRYAWRVNGTGPNCYLR